LLKLGFPSGVTTKEINMKRMTLYLILSVTLAGCGVSKEVVEEADTALNLCRAELAASQSDLEAANLKASRLQRDLDTIATAQAELDACSNSRARAEADLESTKRELEVCREAKERETETLGDREARLRERLRQEIADRTVEIERLKGALAVRVLDEILFASGSADILPQGKPVLGKVASAIASSNETIRVEGHTDDVPIGPGGKDKFFSNWELSASRASSVVRYLQHGHQIEPARMVALGYAEFRPVDTNETPAGRQRNRRVELVLTAAP
jgi:chemotaxis protein MotB